MTDQTTTPRWDRTLPLAGTVSTVYVNPSQQQLDGLGSGDFFLFTSSHEWGPKVAGLTVFEPADSRGYRHSRYFKTFKEAERIYGWTEVVR